MCNLYRLTRTNAEVANLFGGLLGEVGNAGGGEVYPRYPGVVMANGELRSMVWGFPFEPRDAKRDSKPRPVNNARTDKLDSFMWRFSLQERRCLIPVSAFAEAEGEKGAKTRTWFTLPDKEVFAVAGLARYS